MKCSALQFQSSELILEIADAVHQLLAQQNEILGGDGLLLRLLHAIHNMRKNVTTSPRRKSANLKNIFRQRHLVDGLLKAINDSRMAIRVRTLLCTQLGLELLQQLAVLLLHGLGL